MKRKNIMGLIVIVAIVASVLFAGCVEEETPVPAPSPTATPTPEVPTATPTPEPTPEPIALSGRGQEATSKFSLEKGLMIFRMTHDGDRNFIVWLLDDDGKHIDLLVNKIRKFDESKAVSIRKGGNYLLSISADGNWKISIE